MGELTDIRRLVTSVTLIPPDGRLYSLGVTRVVLDDDPGGAFIRVEQDPDDGEMCIQIYPYEWAALRATIDHMIETCKKISP